MRITDLQPHTVLGEFHISRERELFRVVRDHSIKIRIDEAFQARSIASRRTILSHAGPGAEHE
jgi:hypothetical protein